MFLKCINPCKTDGTALSYVARGMHRATEHIMEPMGVATQYLLAVAEAAALQAHSTWQQEGQVQGRAILVYVSSSPRISRYRIN